ncbi:MAG: cell division protein FtsB [Gammaproteobacteria bacterium]|jgi:cell division protein FtsB|nr:cell division protein FtsB [Gammaproteobacteria bacterium]
MKTLIGALALSLCVLQYKLWFGDNSRRELNEVAADVVAQESINAELASRNEALEVEVLDLKTGLEAVEERARSELGMIETGETFYMIVPNR